MTLLPGAVVGTLPDLGENLSLFLVNCRDHSSFSSRTGFRKWRGERGPEKDQTPANPANERASNELETKSGERGAPKFLEGVSRVHPGQEQSL